MVDNGFFSMALLAWWRNSVLPRVSFAKFNYAAYSEYVKGELGQDKQCSNQDLPKDSFVRLHFLTFNYFQGINFVKSDSIRFSIFHAIFFDQAKLYQILRFFQGLVFPS
jgi:hypothetical protein